MAEELVLGLFPEVAATSRAIRQLHELGLSDEKITVMSGVPYSSRMLGRPRVRHRVGLVALAGAVLGLLTGLLLSVGLFLLYPLNQGGQPLVPIPPTLIVLFELTMLGTMWAAFFALVVFNRLPVFGRPAYSDRITRGDIGVLAQVDHDAVDRVATAMQESGAHEIQHLPGGQRVSQGSWALFVATVIAAVGVVIIVSLLFFYDIIRIPFPSNMVNQLSTGYEEGPRLAAPAEAIPIQGPALINGQPASEPVPATDQSVQRGQVFFTTNCVPCHGQGGKGDGPLSGFFNPKPFDLTGDQVRSLSDADIFIVITQGRGLMPSLLENLTPGERWDVINYVRSLQR